MYFHHSGPFPVTEAPSQNSPSPNTFSDELSNSLFCFLRENKMITMPFPTPTPHLLLARQTVTLDGANLTSCRPLQCILSSGVLSFFQKMKRWKIKRLIFLNCPQDTSFLSKEQRTVGERRPVGVSSERAAHSSTFPVMEPSSPYYLNSPG